MLCVAALAGTLIVVVLQNSAQRRSTRAAESRRIVRSCDLQIERLQSRSGPSQDYIDGAHPHWSLCAKRGGDVCVARYAAALIPFLTVPPKSAKRELAYTISGCPEGVPIPTGIKSEMERE